MRGELLKIPKLDRFTFETHFLHSVHSQLRFERIEPKKIQDAKENLASALGELFDGEPNDIFHSSVALSIHNNNAQAQINQPSDPEGLKFVGTHPRVELEIRSDSLVYSEYEYTGFDDFQNRLELVASVVQKFLGVENIRSISLRKINSILIGGVSSLPEAFSVFNSDIFSVIGSGISKTSAMKRFEGSLYLDENGKACVFRYRATQLDAPDKFEAVLDFDLIDNVERGLESVFSEPMDELNKTSFDMFMWAVNKELTEVMGLKNSEDN